MKPASAAHVAAALRELDRDRYFATLVLPAPVRPAAQALFAFSAEVAAVRERVSEPAPGEIRLQWWSDALAGEGHGAVRSNPLADALLDTIAEFGLPTAPLMKLIDARRFDLYHDPMPDLASFEGYAGETVSVLYQLLAMVLNGGRPVETGDAAGHLGVGQALVGHLRAFGYNASRGRIFLPLSVFAANGVNAGHILSGTGSAGVFAARQQLCDLAREHLGKADAAIGLLPRQLRPAFVAAAPLRAQLLRVETSTAAFGLPQDLADWQKIGMMVWRGWRNR